MKTLQTVVHPEDCRAIEEVVRTLRERYPVKRVILFGSAARGTAGPDSDIDLLLLTGRSLSLEERLAMRRLVLPLELKYDRWFGLVAIAAQEWEEGVYQVHPLRREVEHDGVVIL